MSEHDDIVCLILAGGRGKRMASKDRHKVCFPIAGRPAIIRAIDAYKEAGLRRFLIVVGQLAEQVMSTVSAVHPDVLFVFQGEPRGTGHAALVGVEALASMGYEGHVMIVMGDKVTRGETVRRAIRRYREAQPDLLLTALPKVAETSAGRVVQDEQGRLLGLVETADLRQARETGRPIRLGGREFSADQIEEGSQTVNASMYLFRFGVLREALRHISPSNAQGELYLTDTVEHIGRSGRLETFLVPDPNDLMAFNTPAELLAIEEVVLQREGAALVSPPPEQLVSRRYLKPAGEWLALLDEGGPALRRVLAGLYGDEPDVIEERRDAMRRVVQAFIGQYGPERLTVVCRAPGRINLMGRHVDHRGGFVNVMAINREALLAASPREDDFVRLRHLQVAQFPNREFRIYDLLGEETWSGWMDFLNSGTVQRVLKAAPGDWSHYVRAPLLRLQYEHGHMRLKGMDCMVSGNIPMGAGLSSSSALVVAFAEATVALNGLKVAMRDFIDLCGEGEWFVGSRGGSADHAAIRTGQLGCVSAIGFFPFRMVREVPFPEALRVVIAHSGSRAVKSAGARDVFNQRVACYQIAELILKERWPAAAGMEHLRDLSPDHLQVEPADVLRALALLPDKPTRAELPGLVPPNCRDRLEQILASHADVGRYDLRGAALFGISECMRSERFAEVLARGDLRTMARFLRASHDGDRTVTWHDGQSTPFLVDTAEAALQQLAANPETDLLDCSGAYTCSTPDIDRMVDLSLGVPGVVGAQLAGAGLGGCMMVLVAPNSLPDLLEAVARDYYGPRGLVPEVHVCSPVAGAGLLGVGPD
jgi:N-acetylgalactosamine kinase